MGSSPIYSTIEFSPVVIDWLFFARNPPQNRSSHDATTGTEHARRFLKTAVSLTFHDSEGDLTRSVFEVKRQRQLSKITAYHL